MNPEHASSPAPPRSVRAAEHTTSELLDVTGAANYLGVTVSFIRGLVFQRRIRYYKVGKFVRFRFADLDAFVASGRVEPAPEVLQVRLGSVSRSKKGRRCG